MRRETIDRIIFILAAAFNLITAAILVFKPEITLARLEITDISARLLARSMASSVTTWGIAYALVAANPRRFRDFAWLGAISKTIFAMVYAVALLNNQVRPLACIPALIDLIFAVLFVRFLWHTRKAREIKQGEPKVL
ncbi:MAG TPA: hypothetical protein VEF04_02900 [Blastocatellia bacterium]|nr:hypothetical protein [Blastocatellia bacterium]